MIKIFKLKMNDDILKTYEIKDEMPDYQKRVLVEFNELSEKKTKLFNFLNNSNPNVKFSEIDFNLLNTQLMIMCSYLEILKTRIDNFKTI